MSNFVPSKGKIVKTTGLVIRGHEYGEGKCMYTVLTPDNGRIVIDGPSTKHHFSFRNPIQVGWYMNLILTKKGNMHWIRESEYDDPLYNMTQRLDSSALASYIFDVAYELSDDGQDCSDILAVTYNSLYVLNYKEHIPTDIVKAVFEIKAMSVSGYMPSVTQCEVCSGLDSSMYLDVMNGGVICSDCLKKRASEVPFVDMNDQDFHAPTNILCPLTPATVCAMYYIICAPFSKMFSFKLDDEEEIRILNKASSSYLTNHLERSFDSLDYYISVRADMEKSKRKQQKTE